MRSSMFLGMLCLILLVPCVSWASDSNEVYNLTMATFWPSTDFQVQEGHKKWIEEVEERSNGRIQIDFHPGEALLGAKEIYNGVVDGVADIGTTCPSYTSGMFPLTEAFELPGYKNVNATAASMTFHEGYKEIKDKLDIDEFEEVKVLTLWATGPGHLMTRKEPVHNLDDLSDKEIRAVGGTVPPLKKLGAKTHALPMSESYLALDQGIVDGILGPTDILKGFKLAEVVDYATETPDLYNVVFMKVMNQETWNSLPQDLQQIIQEVSEEYALKYGKLRAEYTTQGLKYAKQEHDLQEIQLDPEEEQKWLERIQPVVEEWIQEKEEDGLPAKEVVEIVEELDAEYSQKYGQEQAE
ncbi:MAG: TRAP transporter substrate-binding protein [Desulfohalobiaceae bacterium]